MSVPKFCVLFLVLVQLSNMLSQAVALDSEGEAVLAIDAAEDVMFSAYQAVRDAEMAGADISGFSELLRDAAQLLAQAHTSFRVGHFGSAVQFANLTGVIGKEVEVKAFRLSDLQRGVPVWQMWWAMVQSLFAVLVVVLLSFWSWRVFKRLYLRRVGAMKPEVASDGS